MPQPLPPLSQEEDAVNAYVDSFVETDDSTSQKRAVTHKRINHTRSVGKLAAPLPRAKYESCCSARLLRPRRRM